MLVFLFLVSSRSAFDAANQGVSSWANHAISNFLKPKYFGRGCLLLFWEKLSFVTSDRCLNIRFNFLYWLLIFVLFKIAKRLNFITFQVRDWTSNMYLCDEVINQAFSTWRRFGFGLRRDGVQTFFQLPTLSGKLHQDDMSRRRIKSR